MLVSEPHTQTHTQTSSLAKANNKSIIIIMMGNNCYSFLSKFVPSSCVLIHDDDDDDDAETKETR